MITEMFQCLQAFRNFTSSCIPIDTNGSFNLDLVTPNITNGLCPDSLYNIVNNCIPSSFFYIYGQKDTPCYSSREAFLSCLPANAANLTGWPKTCTLLSWAVFLSNEAITFLDGTSKALALQQRKP